MSSTGMTQGNVHNAGWASSVVLNLSLAKVLFKECLVNKAVVIGCSKENDKIMWDTMEGKPKELVK